MGLDTFLFKRSRKKDIKEEILAELEENSGEIEVAYWRKEWGIVEAFSEVTCIKIENCENYNISKEELEGVYKITDDKQIKKVLDEINWDNEEIIFHNWW
jgi:hypothetical protein